MKRRGEAKRNTLWMNYLFAAAICTVDVMSTLKEFTLFRLSHVNLAVISNNLRMCHASGNITVIHLDQNSYYKLCGTG
jgi:hypothetical protein